MTAAEVQMQPAVRAAAVRRRVLMGVPSPGATGGGPALHLPMLVDDLRDSGADVVTFAYGRWAEGESLPRKAWNQLRDLLRYPGLVRRVRPDLVHLNTAFDRKAIARDVPFALASRMLGVPVFLKWHGSETDLLATRSPLWRPLVSLLLGAVDGIGVLSNEEAAALARRRPGLRRVVVRNGLDLERYSGRRSVRPRLGVPDTTPLLLFIGRLIPAKGLDDVVRALPAVAARHDAHLVVAGDGPARAPAAALVRELGLENRVHFVGRITEDEAADYYCGCDVLVFPTYHPEGFPMTVFQSVAGGLGIVTTRLRATADYLREPENALFVPPRDPAALGLGLLRLLDEPGALNRMRQANRDLARRFDRRTVAAEFAAIYDAVLQPGSGPGPWEDG